MYYDEVIWSVCVKLLGMLQKFWIQQLEYIDKKIFTWSANIVNTDWMLVNGEYGQKHPSLG